MTKGVLIGLAALPLAVGCSADGGGESDAVDQAPRVQDDDQDGGTTTVETEPTLDSVAELDTSRPWELGSSLTGELTQIVAWSDGFAAIMENEDDARFGAGELWYSADGVGWEAAVVRPFGHADDIYALVGQGDQLFALSGDALDGAAPQTLWRQRSGEPWEEILTDDALQKVAVNSDRVIAYTDSSFGIVGVFDTATMQPVEFTGLPETVSADEVILGEVTALDEGFLATASGLMGVDPDQSDRILLYSADGSSWEQHPAPPPGGVGIPYGQAGAPTFEGRNLVASFSLSSPPRGGAWVTDTGIDFEALPDPVTDEVVNATPAAHLVALTHGTDAGFLGVEEGVIYQSFDGLEWNALESPPTWSKLQLAGFGKRGLAHGTVLATDDSLIAVGVHGEFEGWVGLVNPSTEIWVAER